MFASRIPPLPSCRRGEVYSFLKSFYITALQFIQIKTLGIALICKVDLVMWTLNGERTLARVLNRINQVVPEEVVNQRFIVDDGSLDETRKIAVACGWRVISNEGKGISDGANTALKHVETDFFCSFEQDLLLSDKWWITIPQLLTEHVVAASGIRLPNHPLALIKLQEFATERYRRETEHKTSFVYGKTLDNTIYNTKVLREIGGFPNVPFNPGVDNLLAKRVFDMGYSWKVAFNVSSIHLRKSLWDEFKHYYWYGSVQRELQCALAEKGEKLSSVFLRTMFSPLRGLEVAIRQHCWQIAVIYPLIRICSFLGIMKSFLPLHRVKVIGCNGHFKHCNQWMYCTDKFCLWLDAPGSKQKDRAEE